MSLVGEFHMPRITDINKTLVTTMNNAELWTVTRKDLICFPHLHFDQNNSHRNGEIHDLPFLRCDLQKVSQNEYQQFNVFQFENSACRLRGD